MAQHGVCVMLLLLLPYFAAHRLPFPHQTKANRANGRYNSRPLLSSLERTAHIYKIRNYNMLPQSQSSKLFFIFIHTVSGFIAPITSCTVRCIPQPTPPTITSQSMGGTREDLIFSFPLYFKCFNLSRL